MDIGLSDEEGVSFGGVELEQNQDLHSPLSPTTAPRLSDEEFDFLKDVAKIL